MSKIKLIYATRHFGSEQSTINSPGAQDWVARGGVFYVELDHNSSPPNWLDVGNETTSHATFGVNTNSPFVQQSGMNKYLFGNLGVNRNFQYLRLGHNVLTRPTSNSGGDVTIPTNGLGAATEHWFMDLETGAFETAAWKWWTLQGGYVFYAPPGKLLLSITNPNP